MDNITKEQLVQIRTAQVKAASAGFTQSLINNGYPEHIAKDAATIYAANGGLLHKRAANIAAVHDGILAKVASLHK